jgi:hypothetical protein
VVLGVRADAREVLITDVMDAEPTYRDEFPEPSIWPFLAAVSTSVMFVASIFTAWAVVWGSIPIFITLVGWFWPKRPAREHVSEMMAPGAPDPVAPEVRV